MASLLFASFTLNVASAASTDAMTVIYQGTSYEVTPNNTQILSQQSLEALRAFGVTVCSEATPCLYDDLPVGLDDYVLHGGKWTNGKVTYSFVNTSPDITSARERGIVAQAFGLWSNVAKVYPSEVSAAGGACAGNIRISWVSGDHGDGSPFDGPGGVLAHAFYPPPNTGGCLDGDLHFDEAETWKAPSTGGGNIDLCTVAAHELGHSLGLRHSADNNALMAPYYTSRRCYLSSDDIAGIIAVYGTRSDDVILQLEMTATVPPGSGSFRLRENSITVKFKKKGTTTTFHTVTLPRADSDAGGSRADVDGVLSHGGFTSQFDAYWFNKGDLTRTQFLLPSTFPDIDRVDFTLNITNNALTAPATLAASINGKVLGNITISPGNVTKTASFTTVFVNPASVTRDVGANHYGVAPH